MARYIAMRLAGLVATLLVASLIIFAALEVVPGDPARVMLGLNASEEAVRNLRIELGLDRSAPVRYLDWISGFALGDLGQSYTYSVPVSELVRERIIVSLPLALMALALSTAIALPLAMFAAARREARAATAVMGAAQLGIAIPNFWFALLLVYVFAINLQWVPAGGFPGWDAGLGAGLAALALPALALALPQAAILARVTRSALIDALGEDYIRTARAKGLSQKRALRHHALRNALIPVLTILGLQFAFLLAGTIVIENVFYLPGLGRLIFQAVSQRDLIVVESVVLLLVAAVIFVNFLVDLAHAWADPRLRTARR